MADLLTTPRPDPRPDMRLAPADQVLINCAILLVAGVGDREADRAMALACAAEAMGRGNPDHPFMAPLSAALQGMGGPKRNLQAEMALSSALADIGKLRLGGALDALRKTTGEMT